MIRYFRRRTIITVYMEQLLLGLSELFIFASLFAAGKTLVSEHQSWNVLQNSYQEILEFCGFQLPHTWYAFHLLHIGLLQQYSFTVSEHQNLKKTHSSLISNGKTIQDTLGGSSYSASSGALPSLSASNNS